MASLTTLQINTMEVINFCLFMISLVTFIFMYNREQKKKIDSDDLDKLTKYVDQQDRALHHRIDGVEKKMSDDINKMGSQIQAIYEHLLGGKNDRKN